MLLLILGSSCIAGQAFTYKGNAYHTYPCLLAGAIFSGVPASQQNHAAASWHALAVHLFFIQFDFTKRPLLFYVLYLRKSNFRSIGSIIGGTRLWHAHSAAGALVCTLRCRRKVPSTTQHLSAWHAKYILARQFSMLLSSRTCLVIWYSVRLASTRVTHSAPASAAQAAWPVVPWPTTKTCCPASQLARFLPNS